MSKYAIILTFLAAAPGLAQVVSYEATSFPEEVAWVRDETLFPAERWIDGGWLVQLAEVVDPGPPEVVERDSYRRSIAEFAGSETFFVEWVVETDGPREGIPAVSPAVLSAFGTIGILYHTTISEDLVRFLRDPYEPQIWVEIEPGVPHTYRLELDRDKLYTWYIDGQVVDSGLPEGAYPTSDSKIVFLARAAGESAFIWWDYIRYGVIPVDGSGDFDSNGEVNFDDWPYFEECFSDPDAGSWPGCRWADFNGNGGVDCEDWDQFLMSWSDPADPPGLPECGSPPDFDGNGQVRVPDLILLLSAWGPCGEPCEPGEPQQTCPADLDGDCQVRVPDLIILLGSWG